MSFRALFHALPLLAAGALGGPALAAEPQVYFIAPTDGAAVSSPVTVRFGLTGKGVAPAGVDMPGTAHHHVLLNRPPFGEGEDDADMMDSGLYADANHLHFGGGQTETVLDLPPGRHSLQLVLGDANHVPHDPPIVSAVIEITVE